MDCIYIALSQRYDQSKRFTIIASHSPIHTHIHTPTVGVIILQYIYIYIYIYIYNYCIYDYNGTVSIILF